MRTVWAQIERWADFEFQDEAAFDEAVSWVYQQRYTLQFRVLDDQIIFWSNEVGDPAEAEVCGQIEWLYYFPGSYRRLVRKFA